MMWWFVGGALVGFTCFMMGYVIRGKIDDEELKQNREEMGLEEGCYGCKEVGLPCDKNCKFRKENEDEQSEKNDSEEN